MDFPQTEDGRFILTGEQIGELQASEFKLGYEAGAGSYLDYEYAFVLFDGRVVGVGPTTQLGSVENDEYDWQRDGYSGRIMRRKINPWEPMP